MDCSLSEGVDAYLDALYGAFDGFDVQQTTVAVNPEEFETVEAYPEGIGVRAVVDGEEGVLAVRNDGEWSLPSGVVDRDPTGGTVAALVESRTGLRCEIDSLRRVSIVSLQCEVVDGTVWTLSALFSGTALGGHLREDADWRDRGDRIAEPMSA